MRKIVWLFLLATLAARCAGAELVAAGDGKTDCTAAFQKALDDAGKAGGGVVGVPAGRYRIDGNLTIPGGVTLQGTYRAAPLVSTQDPNAMVGTVLMAYAGRGSAEGKPFIELAGPSATVSGLIITYPEFKTTDVPPIPYPPCIQGRPWTDNVAIIDCCILNAYEAIKLHAAHRHLVRNVQGYPTWRGIFVDECYDIGRIENVHFWPFGIAYSPDTPLCKWINENGVAFEFARTDWQYVTNTFCFGYGVGYKFSEYKAGGCNGNFLGIGADCCRRAVLVQQAQRPGILITNGEFVGKWGSTDSVTLEIGEKTEGKVSLTNCSFWGPIDRCVSMNSPKSQFTASACNFVDWDGSGIGSPAIELNAGRAILQGNTFGDGQLHVRIGSKVVSAVVMGNQASDGLVVENHIGKRASIVANETEQVEFGKEARSYYRIRIGANGDGRRVRSFNGREEAAEWPDKGTKRWSAPSSQLLLPVNPGQPYEVTVSVFVPKWALKPGAGVYLGSKRIIAFEKEGVAVLKGALPAVKSDTATLDIRCANWKPKDVIPNSQDTRSLGIALRWVTIRAQTAGKRMFDGNTGEWVR